MIIWTKENKTELFEHDYFVLISEIIYRLIKLKLYQEIQEILIMNILFPFSQKRLQSVLFFLCWEESVLADKWKFYLEFWHLKNKYPGPESHWWWSSTHFLQS